jgi:hypothetical protein
LPDGSLSVLLRPVDWVRLSGRCTLHLVSQRISKFRKCRSLAWSWYGWLCRLCGGFTLPVVLWPSLPHWSWDLERVASTMREAILFRKPKPFPGHSLALQVRTSSFRFTHRWFMLRN